MVCDSQTSPNHRTRLPYVLRAVLVTTLCFFTSGIFTSGIFTSGIFTSGIFTSGIFSSGKVKGAESDDLSQRVRSLLSDRCFFCHGPDPNHREADLRLDVEEEAKSSAIVPGDAEASELINRILSDDVDEMMPPPSSKISLTDTEKGLIRRWIDEGANWSGHWAFAPTTAIEVPELENENENETWPSNEIDHFILQRLNKEKLAPSQPTSKETLIRRLFFDITGLPPTLKQIDRFVSDKNPKAYEHLVDRLLASNQFGERMASGWLDVARYSDTYGYQVDRDRRVWPWRDWVIRAFNSNMPYDQFVTEQIAGDLLPNATDEQILATTFNRLHPQKVEGGSVAEEFHVEYVADRTQTFGTAFLGLTLECCRCHDHKFDPISQKEFYQLFAFFNNVDEAGLYSYFTSSVPTPTLLLSDEATKKRIAAARIEVADAEAKLAEIAKSRQQAFADWLKNKDFESIENGPSGRIAHLDFETEQSGPNKTVKGVKGNGIQLTGDDAVGLKVGNFKRNQPFSVSLWMNTPDAKERAVVFHRSRAWTDAASRGYQMLIEDGRISMSLIHFWPGNAIRVRMKTPIATNQWTQVTATYDGSSKASGVKIFVNGKRADCEVVKDNLYKNITGGGGDNIAIGQRFRDRGFTDGQVDEFKVFDRELTRLEVLQLHSNQSIGSMVEEATTDETYQFFLARFDEAFQSQLKELQKRRLNLNEIINPITEIMVMREMEKPRPTHVLNRGIYNTPGEAVQAKTPSVFKPFENGLPPNRLGLANWLTDPSHPLTKRIAVNRLWQICFGRGLVSTPEDFGSQGAAPSHPQLLDWLADDFVAHGWNVKRTIKKIVMSSTYRQSSQTTVELLRRDPENILLARAPSYRLSAEMLRDNSLAVSGLLVDQQGGAPVRPYEVEVSFKPVKRDKGAGLYRRSLYTYWKRTGPAPAMMALDAAKRDVCRVQRERTSSPVQALVLLNGPQFVEASRVLAEKVMLQHGENVEQTLVDMFRTLTSRHPTDAEVAVLHELHQFQLSYFEKEEERAVEYLKIGDQPVNKTFSQPRLAAMASVANTLFNFDECVMKK